MKFAFSLSLIKDPFWPQNWPPASLVMKKLVYCPYRRTLRCVVLRVRWLDGVACSLAVLVFREGTWYNQHCWPWGGCTYWESLWHVGWWQQERTLWKKLGYTVVLKYSIALITMTLVFVLSLCHEEDNLLLSLAGIPSMPMLLSTLVDHPTPTLRLRHLFVSEEDISLILTDIGMTPMLSLCGCCSSRNFFAVTRWTSVCMLLGVGRVSINS